MDAPARQGVHVTWAVLRPDEALAVADSALRHRDITRAQLIWLADQVRGTGAAQAWRVARLASEKAANPFESALRAIAMAVTGIAVEPQVWRELNGMRLRPDLLDRRRRLILEAESFEWHGKRLALARDCVRYNAFGLAGYVILRFSWEQVMLEPAYVEACLRTFVAAPPPVGGAAELSRARTPACTSRSPRSSRRSRWSASCSGRCR